MLSMTGYGKAEYSDENFDLVVELKSVNNRNFDFNIKAPRIFVSIENQIRKIVSENIIRGRIDMFVSFLDKRKDENNVSLNELKVLNYFEAGKKISNLLNIQNDLCVSDLIRLPDVILDNNLGDIGEFSETIFNVVKKACDNLNEMRKIEGEKICADMLSRLYVVEDLRNKIFERAPLVAKEYKEKLTVRIQEALSNVDYDQSKLLNEVCFFTDKSNIDEELTRLLSHISQFRTIISQSGAGKKLDFLMQEFNRESNTICSKSNDITITNYALMLKNEIEKIREQVQNLE